MIRRLIIVLLICAGIPAMAQLISRRPQYVAAASFTPSFVTAESSSSTLANSTGTTVNLCATSAYCAPHIPALAGNTWIFAVQYTDASTTLTPSDYTCTSSCSAASDTCAIIATSSAVNSKRLAVGYCKNLTAGVNQLKIAFSTNTSGISVSILEFSNIDTTTPVDTSVTNTNAGSTTVQAGSITPGAANKFLVQFAVRTQTPVSASCGHSVSDTKCFTAGTGQTGATWVIHSSDAIDGIVEQDTVYTSASAINPQLTMAASSGYASVAVTFNTASAGSSRASGMQVAQVMHQNQNTASAPASVIHTQMRTEGNLLVISAGFGGDNYKISSVTDNDGCTWVQGPKGILGDHGTGKTDLWYCENSSANANKLIDVNVTGSPIADYTFHVFDITGAKTSGALVQEAAFLNPNAGTQPIHTFDFLGSGATDGIAIYNLQENSNTSQTLSSPSGAVANATLFGGEDLSGGASNPPDEENGWGWLKFTSGNVQHTWTPGFADGTAIGSFTYRVAYFASSTATIGTSAAAKAITNCTHANANLTQTNDGGQEWTIENGGATFKYVSNTCQPNSQSADAGDTYNAVTFANDQWVQITLGTMSGGSSNGGQGIGVFLRESLSARTGYRIVINAAASGQVEISKFVTGTNTVLKHCSASTTPTSGDVWYFQISGTTISLKQNGSSISACDTTDASVSSGAPGMAFSSTMTSSSITAWKAGNL